MRLVLVGLLTLGQLAAQASPPALKILVFNYSAASRTTIASAERQASQIFSRVGLDVFWLECAIPLRPDSDKACAMEPTNGEVFLRLLNRSTQHYFPDSVFGFATPPFIASVYYGSISRLEAGESEGEIPIVLGCLMAHEIGHLLLGPNAHSLTGIMQRDWRRSQLNLALRGELLFTVWQAKSIRMLMKNWQSLDNVGPPATESSSLGNAYWHIPRKASRFREAFGDP
jgi:hypothetical protein